MKRASLFVVSLTLVTLPLRGDIILLTALKTTQVFSCKSDHDGNQPLCEESIANHPRVNIFLSSRLRRKNCAKGENSYSHILPMDSKRKIWPGEDTPLVCAW